MKTRRVIILDVALFAIASVTVVFIFWLIALSIIWQHENYAIGIDLVRNQQRFDTGALLAFARAQDFAIVKTSSMLLGFVLVFVGCIYVLRLGETTFSLEAGDDKLGKVSLQSSSPGLILSALGTLLIIVVMIFGKSWMQYLPPSAVNDTNAVGCADSQPAPNAGAAESGPQPKPPK